jgi:hypothetical protein
MKIKTIKNVVFGMWQPRIIAYCTRAGHSAHLDIVELIPLNLIVVIVAVALHGGAVVVRHVPQLVGLVPDVVFVA